MRIIVLLLLALLCLFVNSTFAQEIKITGSIAEQNNNRLVPIALASVILKTEDSAIVKGVASDQKGLFSFKEIKKGNYILTVTVIGYYSNSIFLKNLTNNIDAGTIILTAETKSLAGVTVQSGNIIQKIDRTLYFPNPAQVKKSSDGFDLLNNLMISRLHTDPVMKQLSVSGGGSVQIRINNIKATDAELSALQAKDILRVEFIENPGMRYGNEELGAVVNFIVKKRQTGGQIALQANNSLNRTWGENYLSAKYNYNKSQWSVVYNNKYGAYNHVKSDRLEIYNLPDKRIERIQSGIYDKMKIIPYNDISVTYNNSAPDDYTFNATFRNSNSSTPYQNISNRMYTTGKADTVFSKSKNNSVSNAPSLDLYYQKVLKRDRNIEFNIVGTYIKSALQRNYIEYFDIANPFTSIYSKVAGNKYSLIGEGIYDKTYKKIKLSMGLRHMQAWADNQYSGTTNTFSKMDQAESNVFAEINGRAKNITYAVGFGLCRSWFKDANNNRDFYTLRPSINFGYTLNKNSYLRYTFNVSPVIPSLSSLTNVQQAIDTIQYIRGNPLLKMYNIYNSSLSYTYNHKKLMVSLFSKYSYRKNPVMENIFTENGKVIISEAHQKYFAQFNAEVMTGLNSINTFGLPDFLTLNIVAGYTNYKSSGLSYFHTYNNFYTSLMATFFYKNYFIGGQYRKFQSALYGETVRKGEDATILMAGYKKNNLQLMLIMMYPFSNNYKTGYEKLSAVANINAWSYVQETSRLLALKLSYNFDFGKKYKTGNKRLNNEDKEAGILKAEN